METNDILWTNLELVMLGFGIRNPYLLQAIYDMLIQSYTIREIEKWWICLIADLKTHLEL